MRATIIGCTISTATAFLPSPSTRTTGLFSADDYAQMRAFFAGRPELAPTPLRELPALARDLGIGRLFAKDESGRFGLNAFKLLGARFAVETLLEEGAIRPGATLVCASEGNHGRAVARAARDAGCAARVYMAHDASPVARRRDRRRRRRGDQGRWLLRRRRANHAGGGGQEPVDDRVGHGVGGLRTNPAADHARLHADAG